MKRILPTLMIVLFFGCYKDELPPTINITSPANNQMVPGGQLLSVVATITDNDGMHMIHLSVTDNTTGGHLVHFEEHFDGKSYHLNQSFTPQSGRNYTIDIEATDHAENVGDKSIHISAN